MFVDLLEKIGLSLQKAGLPYMIIGGQAVLLYGEPRLTRDIDVTLGVDTDQLEKLIRIAETLNLDILPDNFAEFVTQTKALPTQEQKSGIRVDFIFSNTEYEHQAFKRVNSVSINKVNVNFASIEDLIIHKIFASRPRDIEDVRGIILKNKGIDMLYIEHWLGEFDEALDSSLKSTFQSLIEQTDKE